MIGCGGLGLSISGSNFVMDDVWNLNGHVDDAEDEIYDFIRKPDVVVVELGRNDAARAQGTTVAKYKKRVKDFVNNLREKYGNDVPIVWLYGYHDVVYWEYTKEVLDTLGGESANLHYCELSQSYIEKADGGDGNHPDVKNSKVMATELTAYLKKLLNIQIS